jgi:AraC-like DNA-binding protein
MRYHVLRPSPPLADVIERLWLREGPVPRHAFERVLPMGREELFINLVDGELRCYHDDGRPNGRTPGPLLAGMHRGAYVIDTRQQAAIMGVHFKPGGAWQLLGIPAQELSDARLGLHDLIGEEAPRLMDQLLRCGAPLEKLRVVDAAMCRRLRQRLHPAVAWAAEQMRRHPALVRVALLADEAGLSGRRFGEVFTCQVGVNPKGFARLCRFQAALGRIHASAQPDWCDLALRAGYADQAHLIREFRAFSGFTPAAYHASRGQLPHLVPLPDLAVRAAETWRAV